MYYLGNCHSNWKVKSHEKENINGIYRYNSRIIWMWAFPIATTKNVKDARVGRTDCGGHYAITLVVYINYELQLSQSIR